MKKVEDLLKEILYELKEIKKEIRADGSNSNLNPIEMKVSMGEDLFVEKVIDSINAKSRISGRTKIVV